ncbi:ribonuclease III [Candidatus Uhrbacteria bacterium]|nr:ribonuclease III [Candidatus Uhrbacteria bacterium]
MNNQKDFSALEGKLGIAFKNRDILTQAFVHRSYLNEHPSFPFGHNERLEFLGDAVLELVVTDYLYRNYPNPEGEMTNWRAALVNARMLAEIANQYGLDQYMYLSHGESRDSQGKARQFILANAFEALIGAIHLDLGYGAAERFIREAVLSKLPDILERQLYMDPKSRFQEKSQEIVGLTPNYRVLEETGPDHAKKFTVGAFLGDEKVAEGSGTSKQEAQVSAAERALEAKGW